MKPTSRWILWAACFAIGSSAVGHLAFTYIPCLPEWETKTPEWVGAIGAIAAFAGTIVIASTDSWRRRRADTDLATITAAAIMDRIATYTVTIDTLKREVPAHEALGRETLQSYKGLLEKDSLWTREEILPLTVLPDQVAPRLQRIAARHQRLVQNLEFLKYATLPANVTRLRNTVRTDLEKTDADLARCRKEMQHLLRGLYSDDDNLN